MRLVLIGPPGSGKGTQAERLAVRYGVPHLSSGAMLRAAAERDGPLGRMARGYLEQGALVPDDLVMGIVMQELNAADREAGYILDGFPRTLNQAQSLTRELEATSRHLDAVLLLDVPEERIVARLGQRRTCSQCGAVYHLTYNPPRQQDKCDVCGAVGTLIQRCDDKAETIRRRMRVYADQTGPVVNYYRSRGQLFSVNGDDGIEETFERVVQTLEQNIRDKG